MRYSTAMWRRTVVTALGFLVVLPPLNGRPGARQAPAVSIDQLFQKPPADSRIMMRWWWFGPSVTNDEIAREMQRMKEGGIGGFEIAVVYPMRSEEHTSELQSRLH